jgi:hypothetical protein
MPDPNDIPRRRRVLVLDVTQAAAEVSRLAREAYDLNLPVESGVREGRDSLVRCCSARPVRGVAPIVRPSPAQLAEQLPELVGGHPDPTENPGERADGQLVV